MKKFTLHVAMKNFDGVLLPPLDNFLETEYRKNFYLVHLYGSHPNYYQRYPREFEKFTDNNTTNKIIAEYDNSILYSDYIVDEIIRRFEDKTALIIYFSDHGQEIFDNGRNFAGHTSEMLGSRSMIEIPMLIWTSKSFRELYPEKITALANSLDNPCRTDLIIHTMLDLPDIQTESFDATKSFINANFDTSFQRLYNGKLYTKKFPGGLL